MKDGLYYNQAYEKRLADKGFEWAHLVWKKTVPPVGSGSTKYMIWDVVNRRSPKDLVVCEYKAECFKLAQQSDVPMVFIKSSQKPHAEKKFLAKSAQKIGSILGRGPAGSQKIRLGAEAIKAANCKKVLMWDGMKTVPEVRSHLLNVTLAYAQRHYDYPLAWSHYDYCDYLLTQTRGQAARAFSQLRRLTPFVVTIPNGVELDVFKPVEADQKKQIRKDLNLAQDCFTVIFPSKLAPYKGTRYLQQWIQRMRGSNPEIVFLVVGALHRSLPQAHRNQLMASLRESPNVVWVEGVARGQMPSYFKAADVCLMPGVWREGFSMAAIEAMASGLALVAANDGFYPEVITHGFNGLLCERHLLFNQVRDALRELSADRQRCREMGANARLYAEKILPRQKALDNFEAFLENRLDDIDENLSLAWAEGRQ